MKKYLKVIVVLIMNFGLLACEFSKTAEVIYKNNRAAKVLNEHLKKKETKKKDYFLEEQVVKDLLFEALESSSQKEEVMHLNLGLNYELSGDKERAEKSYQQALKVTRTNLKLRFLAHYNLGRIRGDEKKIEEALQEYQKALDIYPDSKKVKTNIELLLKDSQSSQKKQQNQQKQEQKKQQNQQKQEQEQKKQQDQQKQEQKKPQDQQKKNQQREFKSEALSKKDVENILEELKSQEQKIRAKDYNKKVKERPNEKDW